MRQEALLVCLVAVLSVACAWPDLYDNEFKRWSLSRRSFDQCKGSGGKCYSTSDCCTSYVCAAFDDFGMSPTVPGWCVHEKELEPCMSKYDCAENRRCVPLGAHSYCVPLPEDLEENVIASGSRTRAKGGIGLDCDSDADCANYSGDGKSKLCCQKIRRGRQGTVQKCDIIKPISVCIE